MPRPPGYQRSTVLGRATELFWRRGYGATSVADLVTATGLKPGSLYAAFGSKKGLFLEVLAQYNSGKFCLFRDGTRRRFSTLRSRVLKSAIRSRR